MCIRDSDMVVARKAGETIMAHRDQVELADVSPKQIVSVAVSYTRLDVYKRQMQSH